MSGPSIAALVIVIVAFVLLILQASAEVGVISVSRSRARLLLDRDPENPRAQGLQRVIQNRERALGSFALGRSLAVVTGLAAALYLIVREWGFDWEAVVGTAAVGFVIIALAQGVPRRLAERNPEAFGLQLAPTMRRLEAVFRIPAALFEAPALLLPRPERASGSEPEPLEILLEREEAGEGIEADERQMIRGVIEIGETAVREEMVPRADIVAVDVESALSAAARTAVQSGVSRLPVIEGGIDNVVGILYAKDILAKLVAEEDCQVRELMRTPLLVPESKQIDEMLAEFRRSRVHMAIVLDEYGGTAGLITIEDLLEEIVGEIEDEYDRGGDSVVVVSEHEAILDGGVSTDRLDELFHVKVEPGDFDTVAGFVFDQLGKIPVIGDCVRVNGLDLSVVSMSGRRITKLRARQEPEGADASDGRDRSGA